MSEVKLDITTAPEYGEFPIYYVIEISDSLISKVNKVINCLESVGMDYAQCYFYNGTFMFDGEEFAVDLHQLEVSRWGEFRFKATAKYMDERDCFSTDWLSVKTTDQVTSSSSEAPD